MSLNATLGCSKSNRNRGISIVEFVGCLAALGGGIVLGSIYLGVDVKAAAFALLEKADVDVPAILGQESDTNDSSAAEFSSPEATAEASGIGQSDDDQQLQVEGPQDTEIHPAETSSSSDATPVLTEAEQQAATKDCWQALSDAMKSESINRSKSVRDPGNWQLFDYLLHRKRGHSKVVDAISEIDLNGVDPRLKAHVSQVLTWHRSGADLFDRATELLTDAPAGKLSGPFAQSWQSSSTQHRMEEKLILNKHKAVAGYLEHAQKNTFGSTSTD